MIDPVYVVRYNGRIKNPDGEPADTGGPPDGQGPPSNAAPSSVVENVLSNTPAANDSKLADGPPREYNVIDKIEDETGDRVVR